MMPTQTYNFDQMNETDIREEIVRPFLHALGYRAGTEANIRTEQTLKYDKIFLGRKKSDDPRVQGRADYILDVVPFGRWVVEAKPPTEPLTTDDAEQAYTYAAHPEIHATLFLLTNGRDWRLFRTASPQEPLMAWTYEQMGDLVMMIKNMLGPEAIRRLCEVKIDLGKPLAEGLGSAVDIVNGHIVYDVHVSESLPIDNRLLDGLRNGIAGGHVRRSENGEIEAEISVISAYSVLDELNRLMGLGRLTFRTFDEFVSKNRSRPSIFTNVLTATMPSGTVIPQGPITPEPVSLPFQIDVTCFTEAAGFVEGAQFLGTFSVDYQYHLHIGRIAGLLPISLPEYATMRGDGHFEITVR